MRTEHNPLHNFRYDYILLVFVVLSSRIIGLTGLLICCVYTTSQIMQPTEYNIIKPPQETIIIESYSDLGN